MFLEKKTDQEPKNNHFCLISDSIKIINQTVNDFIVEGMIDQQKIIYLYSNQNLPPFVPAVLPQFGSSSDLSKNQLEFMTFEPHVADGVIQSESLIACLRERFHKSLFAGYHSIRLINEMNFSSKWIQGVVDLERNMVIELLSAFPCSALCLYNPYMHYVKTIKEIIDLHPQTSDGRIAVGCS